MGWSELDSSGLAKFIQPDWSGDPSAALAYLREKGEGEQLPDFSTMSREECTAFLEGQGGAVYEDEPIDELREAVEEAHAEEIIEAANDAVDLDDLAPAMGYAYPLPGFRMDYGEAQRILMGTCLCLILIDEEPYLALQGGGMGLSWEICEAYIALGYLPPAHFCDLPKMAGRGDSASDREQVARCLESVRCLKGWMEGREERLSAMLGTDEGADQ